MAAMMTIRRRHHIFVRGASIDVAVASWRSMESIRLKARSPTRLTQRREDRA